MATKLTSSIPIESIPLSEAQPHLDELVSRVANRELRVRIQKDEEADVVILPVEDLERLNAYDAKQANDFEAIEELSRALSQIPEEEFEREFAKGLAEVREEMRAERETATSR